VHELIHQLTLERKVVLAACTAAMTRLNGSNSRHNCFNFTKNMSSLMILTTSFERRVWSIHPFCH